MIGPILDRLLGAGPPLEFTDWALEPAALELVLARIGADCDRVVECGSGLSTIVIARLLAGRGHGRVEALEHEPAWASEVRRRIEDEGVADRARLVEAPLGAHPLAEPGCHWYDPDAVASLSASIDLLLVDGPPAGEPGIERARYPALPALASRLRRGATVILDDAGRPGERWVLDRWQEQTGVRFERRSTDRVAIGCMLRPSARGGSGHPDTERKE
ncbi:MAG: class I SAM-dependent methyltransferase [Solirubrobacterales bacterium]